VQNQVNPYQNSTFSGCLTYGNSDLNAHNYQVFGVKLDGRGGSVSDYRFGAFGYEGDPELKGDGNSYTTEFRQYDPRLGRWLSLDPRKEKYPAMSPYNAFGNNPIYFSDSDGDTLRVTTKKGTFLFDLDDGKAELTTMTAKQLYKKAIQWFEPLADNYMKMLKMNPKIAEMSELKHFTWTDIAKFSAVSRYDYSFFQGGSGDWKKSEEGADGYLLVTVGGKPYWADAIGQIPFAVDMYKDLIVENNNPETVIKEIIKLGIEYGAGTVGGEADKSNTYDNYFVLRGALYAYHKYKAKWVEGTFSDGYEINRTDYSPNNLGKEITPHYKEKYLNKLESNQKDDDKKK